jgi:FKBP-type peptidyl-prolyl cis-trans isomerase SlyD
MQINQDSVVQIHYTLRDADGDVLDRSDGEPLAYLHGRGNLIPGLEKALEGKTQGDKLRVSVPPEEAYGQRDDSLVQAVPKTAFQGLGDVKPGMRFQAETQYGPRVIVVTQVGDETVTVDGNHPLAGQTLDFEVEVAEVREASAEELEHGHAHGAGGHQH